MPTIVIFVLLPVGAAVYSAISNARSDRPPELSRAGSTAIDGAPADEALAFAGTEPIAYVLAYRTERYDRDKVEVSSDRLEIRRPFDGRVAGLQGGRVVTERASRLGVLAIATGSGARTLVSPPAPATADLRLATVLPDAVEERYAEVRERRRVLGVVCQVYRVGSAVSAGTLVPLRTTVGEHSDICVDADGLLLEEVWVKDGRPLQRRVATNREVDPDLNEERFKLPNEQPVTAAEGNGIFVPIDPASGFEGTGYRLNESPTGFSHVGRFLVQPPRLNQTQSPVDDGSREPEAPSVIDVWSRGPDLVVLSQTIGASLSALPNRSKTAEPIDLGPFGDAATVLDFRAVEVRIELPESRFVRLAGTVPRAELIALAKTLRAEVGTGAVPLGN